MESLKYKGIDLEKIKQVQRIKFPNVALDSEMVQLDLKRTFLTDDFKVDDSVMDAVRLQIEAHQNKQREETEMFIICEMAKLFLEEKEKQKRAIERLEEYQENNTLCKSSDDYELGLFDACEYAIEILKEEAGIQ